MIELSYTTYLKGFKMADKVIVFSKSNEEIKVALIEDEILSEIFFEDVETEKNSGKIFIGRIENDVPSLEAFFVNIGINKNGFLRYKDLIGLPNEYKRGDKVIVQVKKDGTIRKGPQLSMQINLPGRYIVYLPEGESSIGISRKITDDLTRQDLRELGEDIINEREGIIFRTNCTSIDKKTIREEFESLRESWKNIVASYKSTQKPILMYSDQNFVEYILRERLDKDTRKIVLDDKSVNETVEQVLKEMNYSINVELTDRDAFSYMNIYGDMNDIFARKITLKNGAIITIDRAEAMTVIDVDSASNVQEKNIEETSFKTNLSAAKEIARQLRLRNISGIIIIDFIDMMDRQHQEAVKTFLEQETYRDKAKVSVVGFTSLGLLELTRKRTSSSIESYMFSPCPVCHGTGRVASPRVVFDRMIKDIHDSMRLFEDDNIAEVMLNVYHNLSGYITPEIKSCLEDKYGIKLKFEFSWNDPNSYNIRFRK